MKTKIIFLELQNLLKTIKKKRFEKQKITSFDHHLIDEKETHGFVYKQNIKNLLPKND